MDKLRAIQVFVAIAEHGTLTKAASFIGTSLPTVVRTLAILEQDLGVRLFNRSTRRIALTEEGELYLGHCTHLLQDLDAVEKRLVGDTLAPSGLIHMTAPLLFGEMHVTPVISEIMSSNPELRIHLHCADRVVDLVEEHLDIAVRIGHLHDSSLKARRIGTVRQVLCASPKLLGKIHGPKHPEDLSALPCLQINGNDAGVHWPFALNGSIAKVPIRGRMICNTMRPAIGACVDGIGFGLFLEYQVAHLIRESKLVALLEQFEPDPLPVHLIYPHARLLSSRVRVTLDILARHLTDRLATARLPVHVS